MDKLISKLEQLPSKYKPIPFWSWNDSLDPQELRRQIRWMKDYGIGGFFMHARGGLKTPYLSEEWMQVVEACCDEAKKLEMNAWAYDENGWPSGFAGGKLLENLSNRDMYITYTTGKHDPSADITYLLFEDRLTRVADGEQPGDYLNLHLGVSASTADILNPDVVKQFLEITHELYSAYFGNAFSSEVTGFFTDEPQYYRPATPYTPMVARYFREKYGVDIFDQLGLLFVEKEGYRTFRYRYWLAMQTLMLDSFAKQVYAWCCDHNIQLTGHYVEEPTMGGQLMCCAGVMPFYEYEHIPGIDWLGSDTKNEVSPRQLNSAAQQLGKKQAITEAFGCCGWNISPADLKRVAGFQYACGVNMMCHHLLPYSEHGQRKKDYPAHFNSINPWIKDHFKDFNDYFSRLGYLLSNSEEPVNVALLHPMRSAYFNYKRGNDAGAIPESELDAGLQAACRTLSARGIGYHFLDETLLEKHGFVENAIIGCGKCRYTYLVIPQILTMGCHTEKLLRQFVNGGGKVLLLDKKPEYLEGEAYDYSYLQSNTTLNEISKAQPCTMGNTSTELYCTYRIYDGKPFLFVQNASAQKGYTQKFTLPGGYRSFVSFDPLTYEEKVMPLTVRLEKNESLLLFPSFDPAPEYADKKLIAVKFSNSKAEFDHNYLTMDMLRYSKDGVVYSAPILCSDLCQQLLRERYEGTIRLRYEFDICTVPEKLYLLAEKTDSSMHTVNGQQIFFDKTLEDEPCVCIANISGCVHTGINCYETVLYWHQSEATYYALFGEGVTETLKNCIAYDSEIEPIYLAGHFGVYSRDNFEIFDKNHLLGSNFYIGSAPQKISEFVTEGMPFFRGPVAMSQDIWLDDPNVKLVLDGDYLTAKVWVNEHFAGEICFQSALDISHWAISGNNHLKVIFTIGNRNLLGPHHSKEDESFVCPDSFSRNDLPGATHDHPKYKFHCFYSA